jgi:transposase
MGDPRLLAAALFDSSINTDAFEAWLLQALLPVLPNGAVVVMDNAPFHKPERIQKVVAAGCFLEYLPPYSPDLNPIEHKWAQARASQEKTRLFDR